MKVGGRKRFLIIGMCLLALISILLFAYLINSNTDNPLITGNRDELKSITIQICDEKETVEKAIIISDPEHMCSIYDHLSATSTVTNKGTQQVGGNIMMLLTYSYDYDNQSGKQDIVFWGTDNNFYRSGENGYVFGENAELHNLLIGLFDNVELDMIGQDRIQPQKITISEYEGTDVRFTASLTDAENINFIFSNLETIETKAILYPGEMSGLALDTEYELTLEYEDQEDLIIFTGTETADTFYRYSKTVSSNGEEGYVYGKNPALYDYIATLFENH